MIVVKLQGGLGNQMFQYACARRLANNNNTELCVDISAYQNMPDTDTPRHYELDCFALNCKIIDPKTINVVGSSAPNRFLIKSVINNLSKNKLHEYSNPSQTFDKKVLQLKDNYYLVGWFQNEKYFKDIREIIIRDFSYITDPCTESSKIIDKVKAQESVSLHVRRGDYVTNKFANKFHGVTNLEYYKLAIEKISESVPKPSFYVFSDDIEWCKKELKISHPTVFVTHNSTGAEDLRIMKECKHNIIANSSFSWWGAWLNKNNQKVVIAPRVWFADSEHQEQTDIIPTSWLKL